MVSQVIYGHAGRLLPVARVTSMGDAVGPQCKARVAHPFST
jgi:hypothetical protein